jgi:serine protease
LQRRQILAVGERHTLRAQGLGQRVGLALTSGASVSERTQVVFASGIDSATLAARLAKEADVEYAIVDKRRRLLAAPNDPLYPAGQAGAAGPAVGQWYLRAPAGEVKSSIDVEPAWALGTGSASIVVAVLDTGVRFDHSTSAAGCCRATT